MTLSRDIARCPGNAYIPPTMDFACLPAECNECARRTEGVRDYIAGVDVVWMLPPGKVPCPQRLAEKGPPHA